MGRRGDGGGAVVEFIGMSLLLLVPLVYLIVAFSRIQAAAYAADVAAQEAARTSIVFGVSALDDGAARSHAMTEAENRAEAVLAFALGDFGFRPEDGDLSLACTPAPCLAPGSDIIATVEIEVDLPGVPGFIQSWLPLRINVTAEATSSVDDFARAR